MKEIFTILMVAILSSNVVFSSSLGICSYLGVSKNKTSSIGMGFALTFVTVLATLISYPVSLLLKQFGIEYMSTICFILIIASLVQFVEMFIKKFSPSLYKALGIYLPLITTNCVVLQVSLDLADKGYNLLETIIYAVSISLGYTLVITLFSAIRVRLDNTDVPAAFKGNSIALITAALMALAFLGFAGVLQ